MLHEFAPLAFATMSSVFGEDSVHCACPPSSLHGLKTIPLSGMNQLFMPCDQVFILPGPIDISRLKKAISAWLTLVPHAAGRFSRGKDRSWAIKLSYPIPITVSSYSGTYTDEEVYDAFPPFLDPLPWTYEPPQDPENHPLTRFKITNILRSGETAVAIHMCHAVVDGISLFRVLNLLNDLYCGASVSDLVPVNYENYFSCSPPYLEPEGETYARVMAKMPILEKGYDSQVLLNKWLNSMEGTDRVDLFFTKEHMDLLLRRANVNSPTKGKRLTTASVLPAYLFTVLNRVYGRPKFNRFLSVLGIRGQSAPLGTSYKSPSTSSAGMAIVQTVSEPFNQEQLVNLSAMAKNLRDHTESCLEPKTLLDITSVYEQRQLELAKDGKFAYMLPEDGDGSLGINLMHRTNTRIHFGYGARQCRFFTWPPLKHYLRAFMANPIRHGDGRWEDRKDVIHVMFLVDKGVGNKVCDLVREELDAWALEDAENQYPHAKL
ncbi:hypothetical protein SCHPADRAFT_928746 [Schizopora paradoxa]|uniref:Uncharacterized protein n=1 Tax=Schizopora paradoxa TaxID=27342 RepID=A0A0H2S8F9_9AGAM|nr:hypothetical protein SCHPADRAFT_928746 [Schizopora paradoxa]